MAQQQHSPTTIENKINKWFYLDDDALRQIKASIQAELELGLRDEEAAAIKMLITYVRELSRGDEIGSYLALDLGGTHFRVLLVTLHGDGSEPKVITVTHDIPHALLKTQNGRELFDYIALKLLEFVKQYKLKRRRISLGFTFSFPCKQYGLTQSVLVKWCKGFSVGGVVGTDVVRQLKDALKRQLAGLVEAYIDVVAVINDTTGTLVACANKNKECRIGLIVGTGFNACYMETLDKCEKWPANYTNPKQVIVNCEWGAMGDHKDRRQLDKFRNEFDDQIDRESVNPLNQCYEKMVAGMYVGELLRLAMLSLYNSKLLFATGSSSCCPPPERTTANNEQERPVTVTVTKSLSSVASNPSTRAKQGTKRSSSSRRSKGKSSERPVSKSPRSPLSVGSNDQHKLGVKDILDGRHLSLLAKDELARTFDETIKILKELNIQNYNQADLAAVVRLGSAIMHRSAHLVASGISALLERLQRKFTVIGYDGSLIKHHPYFLARVVEKTAQLTPAEYKFEFVQSSDGSGIGAAVVAAALHKERRPLYVVKPGKLYELHLSRNPQQSQVSLADGTNPALPGMERVGSVSSRASSPSSVSSASTASGGYSTPPRSPNSNKDRK
jgi:hexokinase